MANESGHMKHWQVNDARWMAPGALLLMVSATATLAFAQAGESNLKRFGSRDPRTCADTSAPAGNNITPALAAKYFACKAEYVRGNQIYLVEDIKVQVGGPVPYTPNLGAFEGINVRVPLRPIRGSYVGYQCRDLVREHTGPASTSCGVYEHTKATGYCYKTTFNDWSCYMADPNAAGNQTRRSAAPKG
jgi:hypothetical protein